MKGEGKGSRRLTQVDAAGGETSVCVVTGLLYPRENQEQLPQKKREFCASGAEQV